MSAAGSGPHTWSVGDADINASSAIAVTFFADKAATTKREETLTLHDLGDIITTTTAAEKTALPWLKLARFGNQKTAHLSLRHNANVTEIVGIEGDYDGECVAFDAACQMLLQAGVAAIIYTSPSCTNVAPRWRVLAPLSRAYPPQLRDKFMARLNGVVGGIFSGESWTLSQSYYFGSVDDNPAHRVQLILGTCIDLLADLDASAIGKPAPTRGSGDGRPTSGDGARASVSDVRLEGFCRSVLDNLRHQAVDGEKHNALLRAALALGGVQVASGFSDAEAWEWLRECLPPSVQDWAAAERTALWGLAEGRKRPIELTEREPHRKAGNGAAGDWHDGPPPSDPPGHAGGEADDGPPPGRDEEREEQRSENGPDPDGALTEALDVRSWSDLELPPQKRLLGDVVTEAARVFLVGATGIGKTLFAYGIAGALASTGERFLHWSCDGPVRVLVIDGEMSARMIKKRAQLITRHQQNIPPGNLLIYSLQRADEFAARFPQLGKPSPLNTDKGRRWLLRMIDLVQPDVVLLDNVMSLIAGVMKEEEPWQQTLPLVLGITALGKAQIWLDHTGHNSDRQYGTSTKGWLFDAIGVMLRPQDGKTGERETCFDLSFDPPTGKARNRDPDRWTDFAPHRIRLTDTGWTSEPIEQAGRKAKDKIEPAIRLFHEALLDAIVVAATGPGETTLAAWEAECVRKGLLEPFSPEDDHRSRAVKRAKLRKAKVDLQAAKMIGIDGKRVMDLSRR